MGHREFCERFFAALSAGDLKAQAGMLHPEFVVVEADGLPYAGVYRGIGKWKSLSKSIVQTWSDFKIRPIEYPAESENNLVVRFALSGKSRKTGKAFETTVMELWRFDDAKLREIVPYYFDTHALALADQD